MTTISENSKLVDQKYLLQRFPGKSGWTYAEIPEIKQDKHAWFGFLKVTGSIDNYDLSNVNLMPKGNGNLFLPVKTEIRKKIKKQEGDWVHIILYSLQPPPVVQDDFFLCLKDDPIAFQAYNELTEIEQKSITDWIFSSKNDEVKVQRIANTLNRLTNKKYF